MKMRMPEPSLNSTGTAPRMPEMTLSLTGDMLPEWRPVDQEVPAGPLLLWTGATIVVGCRVTGAKNDQPWQAFMDARNDDLLPAPTHWMPLPHPPE